MQYGYDSVPTAQQFAAGRVTNPDQSEVIRQRLYDWQLYPTAGTQQLTFFSNPVGQGIATALGAPVGSAKTLSDTNMALPSQLSSGVAYYVESIEVLFVPGRDATANTFLPALPSLFVGVAAAALAAQLNDLYTFYESGLLTFNILNKAYLTETPLRTFPPKTFYEGFAAVSSNSATTGLTEAITMHAAGRPYYIAPPITLQPAVNFNIALNWPALVATPSGFNARVGIVLDGYYMRASQ